jgi:hypothetical protein
LSLVHLPVIGKKIIMKLKKISIAVSLIAVAAAAGAFTLSSSLGLKKGDAVQALIAADETLTGTPETASSASPSALKLDREIGSLSIEFRNGQTRLTEADRLRLDGFLTSLQGEVPYEIHGKEPRRLSGERARGIAFERAFEARAYLAEKGVDPSTGRIFFHTKAPNLTPGVEIKRAEIDGAQASRKQDASMKVGAAAKPVKVVASDLQIFALASMLNRGTHQLNPAAVMASHLGGFATDILAMGGTSAERADLNGRSENQAVATFSTLAMLAKRG